MRIGDEVEFTDQTMKEQYGAGGRIVCIFISSFLPREEEAQIEFPDGSRIWARVDEFNLCGEQVA